MEKAFRLLVAGGLFMGIAAAESKSPKLYMQLMIMEPGGRAGPGKFKFSKRTRPGQGKELRLLVSADRKCEVSAVAFTKDGDVVYGLPEMVQLSDNEAKELPLNGKWTWDGHEHLWEVDVIVADPVAKDYRNYKELVSQMGKPGLGKDVWLQQEAAMRRWIDARLKVTTTAGDYSVKESPTEVGGIIRGDSTVQTVSIQAKKSAVIRVRIPL